MIRHLTARLARHGRWYITESRAFFAARAHTWDTKFGDDMPAYAAAVAEGGIAPGSVAVDVGCGTGRALPALRDAVGPTGVVIGVDLTPQMLAVVQPKAEATHAALVLADVHHLPFADASIDAVADSRSPTRRNQRHARPGDVRLTAPTRTGPGR